ncbi:hypothetical protein [Bacteroides congonensis]|uniref:hypothetical protein n=1 Tax=Bacteroides congonensis TaxID=1871006 RepID=UPI0026743F29|nr:hypothetical protein [Bacteroides congonensis]
MTCARGGCTESGFHHSPDGGWMSFSLRPGLVRPTHEGCSPHVRQVLTPRPDDTELGI